MIDSKAVDTQLKSLNLSYLHAFSFSARKNTIAAGLSDQVSFEIKHNRSKILQRLSENKKLEFYRRCTGKSYNVLWENRHENGNSSGYTENYIRVEYMFDKDMRGKISRVKLDEIDENGIFIVTF